MQKLAGLVKRGVGKTIPSCMQAPVVQTDSHPSADVQPLPVTPHFGLQQQQQPQQQAEQPQQQQGLRGRVSRSSMFAAFKCKFVNGNKPVQPGAAQEDSNTLRDQPAASQDSDVSTITGVLTSKPETQVESRHASSAFAGYLDTKPAQDGGGADLIAAVRAPPDLAHVQQSDMEQSDMQQQGANSAAIGVSLQQVSFPLSGR